MIYRGYSLRWSKTSPMLIEIGIAEGKGSVPAVLKQLFTSRTVAIQHIDGYLSTKKVKDTDAEAINESRGK